MIYFNSKILSLVLICTLLLFFSCKKDANKKLIYQDLIWSDEFDGTSLDLNKWDFQTGGGGWGNNEKQYYTNLLQNVQVSNGHLIITAKNDNNYAGSGLNYTSARLITLNKADWKYGRFEARIKVPSASGVWPAFWMLPITGSWPQTGEIDIMETANANPATWSGTIHYYCSSCSSHQYSGPSFSGVDLSLDFHEYAVEWEPNVIRWYVDGIYRGSQTPSTTTGGTWPFNTSDNFYILLNVAVGGTFTGQTPVSSDYPVTMEVDYVRVYTK